MFSNIFLLLESNMAGFCILLSETRSNTLFHVHEEPSLEVTPPDVKWEYVKSQPHKDSEKIKLEILS